LKTHAKARSRHIRVKPWAAVAQCLAVFGA
jgi:hypothetical protein